MKSSVLPLVLLSLLIACGGSSESTPYELALEAARAKEAEARALVTDTPCSADHQCTAIGFLRTDTPCDEYSWVAHTWNSESEYLPVTLANQQFILAERAKGLAPPSTISCIGFVSPASVKHNRSNPSLPPRRGDA
jgi:hypothetical protein